MPPMDYVHIDPKSIKKDSKGQFIIVKGSPSKPETTGFQKRFEKTREHSERMIRKMEISPLGNSDLLVDG